MGRLASEGSRGSLAGDDPCAYLDDAPTSKEERRATKDDTSEAWCEIAKLILR